MLHNDGDPLQVVLTKTALDSLPLVFTQKLDGSCGTSEALSRKAKLITFLFKATKASETTKVRLGKLVDVKKEKCLIDCFLFTDPLP
jgi:hypothetical protein